jgi:hypothetical protein
MFVRHTGHSGPLQLWSPGGRWVEVWAELDATQLALDGAIAHGGMRLPILALAAPAACAGGAQPPSVRFGSREHAFELRLLDGARPASTEGGSHAAAAAPAAIHLAASSRSELHTWLLRINRALEDARPTPPAAEPAAAAPLRESEVAWPHGTAGVPSLVSPSYRGRGRRPTFHWELSDGELLRLVGGLPGQLQRADGPAGLEALQGGREGGARALHARAARVDAPFDPANPWAATGHVRGSARGRAVALLQEAAASERTARGGLSVEPRLQQQIDHFDRDAAHARHLAAAPAPRADAPHLGDGRAYAAWWAAAAKGAHPPHQMRSDDRARERALAARAHDAYGGLSSAAGLSAGGVATARRPQATRAQSAGRQGARPGGRR